MQAINDITKLFESFYNHMNLVMLINSGKMVSPVIRLNVFQRCVDIALKLIETAKTPKQKTDVLRVYNAVADLQLTESMKQYIGNPEVCNKMEDYLQVFYEKTKNTCIMKKTMSK